MAIHWAEPVLYVKIVSVLLLVVVIITLLFQKKLNNTSKTILFWLIVLPTALVSLYVAGHTVYDNVVSETNGPVHWHADYKVIACGKELDLVDPKFPKNKIGSPVFHEHNDGRIHIEGTVGSLDEISLGEYFHTVGGYFDNNRLLYPTTEGMISYTNGEQCPSGEAGTWKVYVNGKKVENAAGYVPYPASYVPPGDCILVVFDASNADTISTLCPSWEVKGWNYQNIDREPVTVGSKQWQ